mgnify:FL=1
MSLATINAGMKVKLNSSRDKVRAVNKNDAKYYTTIIMMVYAIPTINTEEAFAVFDVSLASIYMYVHLLTFKNCI